MTRNPRDVAIGVEALASVAPHAARRVPDRAARRRTRSEAGHAAIDEAVLDRVCRTVETATGASSVFVAVPASDGFVIAGRSRHGLDATHEPLAAGCVEAVLSNDASADRHGAASSGQADGRHCFALPLAVGPLAVGPPAAAVSTVAGALCAVFEPGFSPGASDLDILSDLAALAARLLERAQRAEQDEKRIRRFRHSMAASPNHPWIADAAGRVLEHSDRLPRLVGPLVGLRVEHVLASVCHPEDRDGAVSEWMACRREGRVFDREVRGCGASGERKWYRLYAAPRWDEAGAIAGWFGTSQNVTGLRREHARLEHIAFRDGLTGLINRTALTVELERRLRRRPAAASGFALLALDLDDFRAVTDTLGYPAGNTVLRRIAECLQHSVRHSDIVARSGADEFFILLDEASGPGVAVQCADRIINALRIPVRVDDNAVAIGASIGITLFPRDGRSADDLLRNVDLALQRAKLEGGGTWRLFEPSMDETLRAAQAMKVELRDALHHNQFVLEFQPVVDARDGRIEAFEALIRWCHPTRGLVSPLEFIPLAETTGLIVPIGRWVLIEACRAAVSWPGDIRVAVNVSGIQIRHRDLMAAVEVALATSGLSPDRLEIEITESILLQDDDDSLDMIRQLRKRRIRIAVDDFGTGHATPRTLRTFPFDKLKLDRAYVAAEGTPWSLAIVRAAIAMARALDLAVVAEGVETARERDLLQAEGCHLFQGFLFGRPMSADEVSARIAASPTGELALNGP